MSKPITHHMLMYMIRTEDTQIPPSWGKQQWVKTETLYSCEYDLHLTVLQKSDCLQTLSNVFSPVCFIHMRILDHVRSNIAQDGKKAIA